MLSSLTLSTFKNAQLHHQMRSRLAGCLGGRVLPVLTRVAAFEVVLP